MNQDRILRIWTTGNDCQNVEYAGYRYIFENRNLEPRSYFKGEEVEELTVVMHRIAQDDRRFDSKQLVGKTSLTLAAAGVGKALQVLLADILTSVDIRYSVITAILIKISLYCLVIALIFLWRNWSLPRKQKKVAKLLLHNKEKYLLTLNVHKPYLNSPRERLTNIIIGVVIQILFIVWTALDSTGMGITFGSVFSLLVSLGIGQIPSLNLPLLQKKISLGHIQKLE